MTTVSRFSQRSTLSAALLSGSLIVTLGSALPATDAEESGSAAALSVIDVRDTSRPQLVGAVAVPGGASDVAVDARTAYVASGSGGLVTVQASAAAEAHSVCLPSLRKSE